MARKYEKHVLTNVPVQQGPFGKAIVFAGIPEFGPEADFSISMLCVKEPQTHGEGEESSHKHDEAHRFFIFMSMNPDDLSDLGGTVEFCLGPEKEKYVINKTTTFWVPKGFYHCPLKMTRVDRPFLFIYAVMSGNMPPPPDEDGPPPK